jgi:hypothetical protein
MLIILGKSFDVADVLYRREDGEHFAEQLLVNRLRSPTWPNCVYCLDWRCRRPSS